MDSLVITLGHHYVTILLAKMVIWAPSSQSMYAFYFCINPCLFCLMPATLLKKRLWHRCFPVNFAKFLRTPPVAALVVGRIILLILIIPLILLTILLFIFCLNIKKRNSSTGLDHLWDGWTGHRICSLRNQKFLNVFNYS